MQVTFYRRPNGNTSVIEVTNILPEDEAWFKFNNVKVSMEEVAGQFVLYGDCGVTNEYGEPAECIVFSSGRAVEDFYELRLACEEMINKGKKK